MRLGWGGLEEVEVVGQLGLLGGMVDRSVLLRGK